MLEQVYVADQRYSDSIDGALDGVDAVVACSGTTAFPSKRWDGDNGPEMTDKQKLKKCVLWVGKNGVRFTSGWAA